MDLAAPHPPILGQIARVRFTSLASHAGPLQRVQHVGSAVILQARLFTAIIIRDLDNWSLVMFTFGLPTRRKWQRLYYDALLFASYERRLEGGVADTEVGFVRQ